MTSLVRRILPVSSANRDDHDEYNVDYSFAVEYSGPPVTYDVPRVVPVNVDRIPTAVAVASASMLSNLSLPVIQPIVKSNPVGKKLSRESNFGSEAAVSPVSWGEFDGSDAVMLPNGHGISCKSVNVVHSSDGLGLRDRDEHDLGVLDGTGSSGSLGFSVSRDNSHELSGSSGLEDLRDGCREGVGFGDYSNPASSDLNKSGLSSPSHSLGVSTSEGGDYIVEAPSHGNRTTVATFRDPESSGIVCEETEQRPGIIQARRETRSNLKKGLCHRCHKGNRFTEKEVCIVCSAKYCSNCVLRAMGSMPEGRKCIPCIGYRIDESKRGALGKCSRMLKCLLTDWEVKRIVRFEISCEANQLPPELVYVNGKPLCHEEFVLLQSCSKPPRKLKPGKYWYDKVSGLWGKEGQRACQIISSQLLVGAPIMQNASNGNTNVLINNREITQVELWTLKMAGIHCEGNPHFWVSADGAFQEEGQKNELGRIWNKTGIKLVCALLSLPIPSESAIPCGEEVDDIGNKVVPNYIERNTPHKILLVGYDKSGTSTIFKQAKIIYNVPFSEDERRNVKFMIQSNLYGYLGILLEGRAQFEEECSIKMRRKRTDQAGPSANSDQLDENNIYSISPRLKAFSDWLFQVMMSGNLEVIFPAATREYAPLVEELWKDKGFQATYSRRNELNMLPRVANYFLDRAVEISRADYEPSDLDILYAEGITSSKGLACMEFSFPKSAQDSFLDPADQDDPLLRYQLIRVHSSSLGENCKWLEMFEDVDLVLFCVALTDYDQFSEGSDEACTNKMMASKKLFENIVTHPTFCQKDFLLILNKFDLLEEKIEQVPLTRCEWFHDFNPVISHNPNSSSSNNPPLAQRTFHYIAVKFKRLFYSLTGRKLYVSMVTGLEPDSVDDALRYGREILKWEEDKGGVYVNEWSSESIEASSTSGFCNGEQLVRPAVSFGEIQCI